MAKNGIQGVAVGRSDVFRLPLDAIHVRAGWNVRERDFDPEDEDDLALARSIAQNGVREPLTGVWSGERVELTNGHRRRAAAIHARDVLGAEIKSVPVQTEPRQANEADHVLSMVTRNAGKPLTPFEKSKVFARLTDLGWSTEQIAEKAGLTAARIRQLLGVQAAPEPVKRMVAEGKVSADLAVRRVRAAKGDTQKVTTELQQAVDKAKAAGGKKASARHVEAAQPARRVSAMSAALDMLKQAVVDETDPEVVTIRVPVAEYRAWRAALGA